MKCRLKSFFCASLSLSHHAVQTLSIHIPVRPILPGPAPETASQVLRRLPLSVMLPRPRSHPAQILLADHKHLPCHLQQLHAPILLARCFDDAE